MEELSESEYQKLAEVAIRRIEQAFNDVDPDIVDCERTGDVVTLTFKGGRRAVLNTQRPTRQIWFAANSRGWHFRYDGTRWVDEKDPAVELFATVASAISASSNLVVTF